MKMIFLKREDLCLFKPLWRSNGQIFRMYFYTIMKIFLLLILMFLVVNSSILFAYDDETAQYRILLGIKIFPTLVTGDLDLSTKLDNSKVILLVVSQENKETAIFIKDKLLEKIKLLAGYEVDVFIVQPDLLSKYPKKVAGIFIAEPLGDEVTKVIKFSENNNILVFSPFEEDLRLGVMTGISVAVQVKPAINMDRLKLSGVRMHEKYIKIFQQVK
jgi:hypothetical protein